MVEGKDLLFTKHRITETGFLKQAITDFFWILVLPSFCAVVWVKPEVSSNTGWLQMMWAIT
jgi:hypothetical protein